MKNAISVLLSIFMLFMVPGCNGSPDPDNLQIPQSDVSTGADEKTQEPSSLPETSGSTTEPTKEDQPDPTAGSTLVVYFSCTGNTKAVAERIADICSADIYEIVPAEPYTSADLNYNDDNCRANREMNNENARPEIGSQPIDLSGYDTVFVGYPIWWGTMPRIMNTFLDACDLSGKAVMPFCTSGGSGISASVSVIRSTNRMQMSEMVCVQAALTTAELKRG